jgi:mRNA interferase MazF
VVIRRGSLWWSDLGEVRGSAPAGRRPVLVVQADLINDSSLSTCIVATITSNTSLAEYPGNVFVPASASQLGRDSVVNVTQISTIDRDELTKPIGDLPPYLVEEVERGIRLVLAL